MLGNRKLVLDTFCEVYDLLKPWADHEFWRFSDHDIVPNAIYLIGRQQVIENLEKIKQAIDNHTCLIILSNPAEGSDTQRRHCQSWGLDTYIKSGQMLMISGGDIEPPWANLLYDSFLPKMLDYKENIQAAGRVEEIFARTDKPYSFLFLNGRYREHRRWLIEHLDLSRALWTNLDRGNGAIRYLPAEYEFDFYQEQVGQECSLKFVKHHLFRGDWGEIYLKAEPYINTYFSLVTETVFEYPYSFRTEKIWKPICMGHPFILAANSGYYRDLRNLGFQTFDGIIDESFDLIENNQTRLQRISQVVNDLCKQDLAAFIKECYNICKYNQQHLVYMREQVRKEFPDRFFQFIKQYHFDE